MGIRQARKQATRGRVLDAARDLFEELGYERATLRLIARRAGVAVGSVFTTFSGKSEILNAVMDERVEGLCAELEAAAGSAEAVADRLRAVMAAHYRFEMRRLRLFLAYVGAAYLSSPDEPATPAGRDPRVRGILRRILDEGVGRGEVRKDADLELFIDVLAAAYFWNYRLAALEGWDVKALIRRMNSQLALLMPSVAAN